MNDESKKQDPDPYKYPRPTPDEERDIIQESLHPPKNPRKN